jgi:hypothetical protein
MKEENFNMSIRKFLKVAGVGSQREIEQAVARAIAEGRLKGFERFPARMRLSVPAIGLEVDFEGEITLE